MPKPPMVSNWYCPDCGEVLSSSTGHECPGPPAITVYPNGEPQAAWVRRIGSAVPQGAQLVYTIWVDRTPIGVYVKHVRDDREGHDGTETTVRTYH